MNDPMAIQGLCLGLLMLSAHFFGQLALKLRIGQMIGQLFGGVIAGPYFLKMSGLLSMLHIEGYERAFAGFSFLIFVFLGVIAFALGEDLHRDRLKEIGVKSAIISMIQAGITWVALTVTFFLIMGKEHWPIALIVGSIGVATAPAMTFIMLNTFEIEGRFRNLLANIVVLDDVFEVILFSIFMQVGVRVYGGAEIDMPEISGHVAMEFAEALLLGFGAFLLIRFAIRKPPEDEEPERRGTTVGPSFVSRLLTSHPAPSIEVLVIIIGTVGIVSALGLGFRLPFLMVGITAGVLVSNFHSPAIFDSLKIENVMPLLNLVFFALIGANINIGAFNGSNLWLIIAYIAARGVGKIGGTWIGCRVTGQDRKVQAALPFLMLPQAGVAAVEAVYVVTMLPEQGKIVTDVVLPSLVVFEFVGVFFSEQTLLRWRQWTTGETEILSGRKKTLRESFAPNAPVLRELAAMIPKGLGGVRISAATLPDAIHELADELEAAKSVVDHHAVLEKALARETLESTAIGGGVALPHAKVLGQARSVLAIGVLESPLREKGPDGTPIDTVAFLVSSSTKPEEHLHALATVARAFSDDAFRESFVSAVRAGETDTLSQLAEADAAAT